MRFLSLLRVQAQEQQQKKQAQQQKQQQNIDSQVTHLQQPQQQQKKQAQQQKEQQQQQQEERHYSDISMQREDSSIQKEKMTQSKSNLSMHSEYIQNNQQNVLPNISSSENNPNQRENINTPTDISSRSIPNQNNNQKSIGLVTILGKSYEDYLNNPQNYVSLREHSSKLKTDYSEYYIPLAGGEQYIREERIIPLEGSIPNSQYIDQANREENGENRETHRSSHFLCCCCFNSDDSSDVSDDDVDHAA